MCLCAEEITEVWQRQRTEPGSEIGVSSENIQTSRIVSFLCATAKDDWIYCLVRKHWLYTASQCIMRYIECPHLMFGQPP